MELLESFLPLVIFLLYLLSQVRKARRNAQTQPPPIEPADRAEDRAAPRRTPFEELVRQIQEAAEAEREAATPSPRPAPGASPIRPDPEFRAVGSFEHEQHGFGLENAFSEEAFEQLPRGLDITEHPPGHLDAGPHALRPPTTVKPPKEAHPLLATLRHPDSARQAFVLKEIFDAPRSRRRHRLP